MDLSATENDHLQITSREKHESIIITEEKNTWPGIIVSQRLDQDYTERHKHRKNNKSKS